MMVQNEIAESCSVDRTEVRHVVSIGLEKANHRIFGIKDLGIILNLLKRTVITYFVCAISQVSAARRTVKTVSTVRVVGLPAFISSLEKNGRLACVVADHERNETVPTGIVS